MCFQQIKSHSIDHVYILQEVNEVSAERIKELDQLLKSGTFSIFEILFLLQNFSYDVIFIHFRTFLVIVVKWQHTTFISTQFTSRFRIFIYHWFFNSVGSSHSNPFSENILSAFKDKCGGHGCCDYSEALFLCIKRVTSRR